MKMAEIINLLRMEARNLDDVANVFTQEAIIMREAAAKLEEMEMRKEREG